MTWLLGALGLSAVALAIVDMVWTTLAVSAGAGPVTGRLSHSIWEATRHLTKRRPSRHRLLTVAGILVVTAMILTWILLLWAGWWLTFAASPDAVVGATTGEPAGWIARGYYAGFSVLTLGTGDFVPGGSLWQLLTVAATFSGLILVTLGVTYLIPVTSAALDRRTLALDIANLGRDPESFVLRCWDGDGWHRTAMERVATLTERVEALGQKHLAYPVLHYFHDREPTAALPVMLPVLDEALTILRAAVREDARPDPLALELAHGSVTGFLGALVSAYIEPHDEAPPASDLEALRGAGVPTISAAEWAETLAIEERRRRTLMGLALDDGWDWGAVRPER